MNIDDVANDPTSIGVKLALNKNRKLDDLVIVNIGTGISNSSYNFRSGACQFKWMVPTIEMLMNGASIHNYMLYHNEGLKYYNFDVDLVHGSFSIDNITQKNLAGLDADAKTLIKNEQYKLDIVTELIK